MLAYTAADNMATENNNAAADPSTTAKRFSSTFNDLPKNQITQRLSLRLAEKTRKNRVVGMSCDAAGCVSWFFEG